MEPMSENRFLSCVRVFFNFMVRMDYYTVNPLKDKGALRHRMPIEQKESMKWLNSYHAVAQAQQLCPETMLVSVGDREAGIYELFEEATEDSCKPKLLVRAMRGRNRTVEQIELWQKLSQQPVAGVQEVRVPRKGKRRARTAKLAVRFSEIRLDPPKRKNSIAVTMWRGLLRLQAMAEGFSLCITQMQRDGP